MKIGDEMIEKGNEIPRDGGRVVLAYGEVTGHAHAITSKSATLHAPKGADVSDADALRMGTRILSARASVALTHEEHSRIDVPRGEWGVRIQRQYDEGVSRPVED
jgi:hypothetical protein